MGCIKALLISNVLYKMWAACFSYKALDPLDPYYSEHMILHDFSVTIRILFIYFIVGIITSYLTIAGINLTVVHTKTQSSHFHYHQNDHSCITLINSTVPPTPKEKPSGIQTEWFQIGQDIDWHRKILIFKILRFSILRIKHVEGNRCYN